MAKVAVHASNKPTVAVRNRWARMGCLHGRPHRCRLCHNAQNAAPLHLPGGDAPQTAPKCRDKKEKKPPPEGCGLLSGGLPPRHRGKDGELISFLSFSVRLKRSLQSSGAVRRRTGCRLRSRCRPPRRKSPPP